MDFGEYQLNAVTAKEDLEDAIAAAYMAGMTQDQIDQAVERVIEGVTLAVYDAIENDEPVIELVPEELFDVEVIEIPLSALVSSGSQVENLMRVLYGIE